MTRACAVHDRVAIRDYRDMPWRRGVVTGVRPDGYLMIRCDEQPTAAIRAVDDVRVVHEHQVPIDERHWLDQDERDQLVRQEAAGRLRAMREAMPAHWSWADAPQLAEWLDNPLLGDRDLATAARALLNPAPQPATTP